MADASQNLTAIGFYNPCDVSFHGMTEGIVCGQYVPGFAAFLNDRGWGANGQCVGVIDVLNMIWGGATFGESGSGKYL